MSQDIDVGIITYERPDFVEDLLLSIEEQTKTPQRVFVVDDSVGDVTQKVVGDLTSELSFDVEYIRENSKTIQGEARNKIIEESEAEVICFIDDDSIPTENWLKEIEASYEKHNADAVGGPALTADEDLNVIPDLIQSDRNQNWFNKYGETKDESERWVPSKEVRTQRFLGANMSFKREILEEIGGFSDGFRGNGYREEDYVMAKIWKRGSDIIYNPEAKTYHFRTPEGGANRPDSEAMYWKGRNIVRFKKECFPENYATAVIRLLIKTDGEIPPLWKDVAGMIVYKDFKRIYKFKGYMDEILDLR